MTSDDKFRLIVIAIFGVLAVVVFIIFSCYVNQRKKLQPPELSQTLQWQQQNVSTPTYQPRNIGVEIGKSDTTVKKFSVPLRPHAVDDCLPYQTSKKKERLQGRRDDGGSVVMTAASTSAFGGGCGGSGGGDSSCSGGGGGCGGGGGGCGGGGGG